MGIGSYRHLVTLEHPAVVLDPPTWYCAMQPAGTQAMEGLAAFFIRGRFHPGIGLETQINFEGRTFQVQAVNDLDERHTEIQVTAVEVVGRGTTPGGAPVFVPPTITVGPVGATIDAGESVMLTVIAVGAVPLFYQWLKDGADLAGEVHQFLDTGPLEATATYAVRVSNAYGSVVSAPAIVDVVLPPTYQETVIADGAVAYWPLDDPSGTTARDLMGTYDGTISGGVTLAQPGIGGALCMVFDAAGEKIVTPPLTIPAIHSVEVWHKKYVALGASPSRIISLRNAASYIFDVIEAGQKVQVWFGSGAITSVATIPFDAWVHLVAVFDGAAVSVYINGVFDSSVLASIAPMTAPIQMSYDGGDPSQFCRGELQDVAIYPRALTPAEIAAHYALRVP